jgi:hypothetical protein
MFDQWLWAVGVSACPHSTTVLRDKFTKECVKVIGEKHTRANNWKLSIVQNTRFLKIKKRQTQMVMPVFQEAFTGRLTPFPALFGWLVDQYILP